MSDSVVLFDGVEIDLDISSVQNSLAYIQDHIISNLLKDDKSALSSLVYQKITKNDNIEKSVEKLKSKDAQNNLLCIYSYGPHIQKLLSILEIFKKVMSKESNVTIKQWNKLSKFRLIEQGRNELLDKKTIVPVIVVFITFSSTINSAAFDNDLNGFTKQ